MPAQRRTSIGTLRDLEFSAPAKVLTSSSISCNERTRVTRRASLGGNFSNLDALQAASMNTVSTYLGVRATPPVAVAESGRSRPVMTRSMSGADVKKMGGAALAAPPNASMMKRTASGGTLQGLGRRNISRRFSNDTGMSIDNGGICTSRRNATGAGKLKMRRDHTEEEDKYPSVSGSLGGETLKRIASSSTSRANRKALSSSQHSKGTRRVKSQGQGTSHQGSSHDPVTSTKQRGGRRLQSRNSERSLASAKSIGSRKSSFGSVNGLGGDDESSTDGDHSVDEVTEKYASMADQLSQSIATETVSRSGSSAKVLDTPAGSRRNRSRSKSKLPKNRSSSSKSPPKRTSSRTKLQAMIDAPVKNKKTGSVSTASRSKSKSDASVTSKTEIPTHFVEVVPNKHHDDSCDSHDGSSPCSPTAPAPTTAYVYQYNPNAWTCVCGFQLGVCMKFCGMCRTPQHWTCDECSFDQNPCVFKFCGGCAAEKPADALTKPRSSSTHNIATKVSTSNGREQKNSSHIAPLSPASCDTSPTLVLVDLEYE